MKIAYSCVVDANPKFEWQAFLLVHSLLRNVGCAPENIKTHCLPGVTGAFRDTMEGLAVVVIDMQPFNRNHPYCNKINQCFSEAFKGYDKAILMDCDLFFLFQPQVPVETSFAAKIVDMPNPPLEILQKIYHDANVQPSSVAFVTCALSEEEKSFRTNLNGGFYFIDTRLLLVIGQAWEKHAKWLLDRLDSLGQYKNHVDQISMALALDELKITVTPLAVNNNFPIHLRQDRIDSIREVSVINVLHYHSHFLPSGQIKPTNVPYVDKYILEANRGIENIISNHFNNLLFWNMRYELFPDLGSGIGSRGEILEYKKDVIKNATSLFDAKSAIDVGCGDLETTKALNIKNYAGFDLSASALEIAKGKRPDWSFVQGSIGLDGQRQADLVICLDVLIHQKSYEEYRALVSGLIAATQKRLIVSGYEYMPREFTSNIIAFHEPLSKTLKSFGVFNEILEIGQYRETSVIVADKMETGPNFHSRDIPIEVIEAISPFVHRKDILRLIMDTSRKYFGFFTKTSKRSVEYPWVLEKLLTLDMGSQVLDIGAGISPLPIILAERGFFVETVDSHSIIGTPETKKSWSEWGFFDYSMISPSIRSFNVDITEFKPSTRYDAIYSLSVIEHTPPPIWEETLKLASAWLKHGGILLLTLDIFPQSIDLWNSSEGRTVDSEKHHGTLNDIKKMAEELGFVVQDSFLMREIPYSRTDVAFLAYKLDLS